MVFSDVIFSLVVQICLPYWCVLVQILYGTGAPQSGELRGGDVILDRSKSLSEWVEQCSYMGMKSRYI